MREIKFQGLRPDGIWEYGDLYTVPEKGWTLIRNRVDGERFFVRPETVGQFTGINDISGADIYEGDVITFKDCETDEYVRGAVEQSVEGTWWVECAEFRVPLWNVRKTALILNNIHDVPELLEGKDA